MSENLSKWTSILLIGGDGILYEVSETSLAIQLYSINCNFKKLKLYNGYLKQRISDYYTNFRSLIIKKLICAKLKDYVTAEII